MTEGLCFDIQKYCEDKGIDVITADGLEAAAIAITFAEPYRVIYDTEKVFQMYEDQGMTEEEAQEYFMFNVLGSLDFPGAPIFTNW